MARTPLMAGNWKMNLNHLEAIAFVQKLAYTLTDNDFDGVEVAVLPPYTDIRSVQTVVDGDRLQVAYGAQDVSAHDSGAYTGDLADGVRILYGGSVKPDNVRGIMAQGDVDGALVGGASLSVEDFAAIVRFRTELVT